MRQVALVAINIVEILFLIWVQVLAPLKRVDGLKGFAKCDLITYRPRKINSAELRVGLRKDLRKEGHIVTLRRFKLSSSLNPLEYFLPCQAFQVRELGDGASFTCLFCKADRFANVRVHERKTAKRPLRNATARSSCSCRTNLRNQTLNRRPPDSNALHRVIQRR